MLCFFFFKQKTAYEMRISDWSSDVCSSDLFVVRWLYSNARSYELPLSISNEYKLNNMYIVVNDYKKDDLYSSLNDEEAGYGGYNKYYANYSAYYDDSYYENEDSWWDKLKKRVTVN